MFIPSLDLADASQASLYSSLSFFSSVILKNGHVDQIKSLVNQTGSTLYWAYANSVEEAILLWDVGVLKVIFSLETYLQAQPELVDIAEDRIAVVTSSLEKLDSLGSVSTFIFSEVQDLKAVSAFSTSTKSCLLGHGGERTTVVDVPNVSIQLIADLQAQHLDVIVPAARLTANVDKKSDKLNIAEAFLATAKTDRPDGLYTTMVVDEFNKALGLVYSSKQSVAESIRLGQGVYQSRGRGLWHKGLTSGATQTLKHIDYDCDGDALRFVVEQHGAGKY
jgi:phosphoribosyl-ATP pyrophosphohydrolase/phosphoribosyl-AMP cyclohydrolase/histidinol dehydrogenase